MTLSKLASVINYVLQEPVFAAVYTPRHKCVVPAGSQGALESSTMKITYSNMLKCALSIRLEV